MLKEGVNFAFGEIGWIIWKELCKKFAEFGLIKFLIKYFPEPYGKILINIMIKAIANPRDRFCKARTTQN